MTETSFDLPKILADHQIWLEGNGGSRANLSDANLKGADLSRANLSRANLSGANLSDANLRGADFSRANLRGANLSDANLRGADFSRANLRGADFSRADLRGADFSRANLRGADFSRADLRGAYLIGANLKGVDLPAFSNCPSDGAFTAWKKLSAGSIARLLIPDDAARVSPIVGRKCRAEFAVVVAITDASGSSIETGNSKHNDMIYTVGEIVRPDTYDPDIRVECSHGIHFFVTKQEAEEY